MAGLRRADRLLIQAALLCHPGRQLQCGVELLEATRTDSRDTYRPGNKRGHGLLQGALLRVQEIKALATRPGSTDTQGGRQQIRICTG